MVPAVGDPHLSPPESEPDAPEGLAGRGLVVFPRADRRRRPRLLVRFAPFLATVALGAVVVAVVALVR
ncbi:MAG TPA: hypothetical protein VGF70_10700 [Solirubrobacteraceae bacterium]